MMRHLATLTSLSVSLWLLAACGGQEAGSLDLVFTWPDERRRAGGASRWVGLFAAVLCGPDGQFSAVTPARPRYEGSDL